MTHTRSPTETAKLLTRIPLFNGLQEDELICLAKWTRERPMRSNEVLLRRNDNGGSMLVILAGEVRVVLSGAEARLDGRDQILKLLGPGDVFGEIAPLDNGPRSADVIAASDGRLLVLERRDLIRSLLTNEELALRIIVLLCNRLRSATSLLEKILYQDVSQRLASVILDLSEKRPGRRLNITQRVLGEFVGTSRETVNKKLRAWQEAGLIAIGPGHITVLDPVSLGHHAASRAAVDSLELAGLQGRSAFADTS